ncbi:MAG: nitroreductase family protein [Nitrospirae bacterium]|nr:nitroreductase family protein [Nitrospirota bacterium]
MTKRGVVSPSGVILSEAKNLDTAPIQTLRSAQGDAAVLHPYPVEEIGRLIRSRRSVRLYERTPVPEETIRKIIDLAHWAPSGMNAQPWKFVVVRDTEMIDKIRAVTLKGMDLCLKTFTRKEFRWRFLKLLFRIFDPGLFKTMDPRILQGMRSICESKSADTYHKAPVLILILGNKRAQTWLEDCSAATQNLALAAHAMGLGSCWIGFAKFIKYSPNMMKKLRVPRGWTIASVSTLGYPWQGTAYDQPSDRKEPEISWL